MMINFRMGDQPHGAEGKAHLGLETRFGPLSPGNFRDNPTTRNPYGVFTEP